MFVTFLPPLHQLYSYEHASVPRLSQVRRAAFELCSLEGLQADNWLCLAKRARAAGQFAVAGAALRRAGRLGVCQERLAFEEAKLARERDGVRTEGVPVVSRCIPLIILRRVRR